MGTFDGKVALVTGAARGLGRVTVLAFARAGARVAFCDIDTEGGAETLRLLEAEGGTGLFVPADVRIEHEVEALVARTVEAFGRLDCAVNNAAVVRFRRSSRRPRRASICTSTPTCAASSTA